MPLLNVSVGALVVTASCAVAITGLACWRWIHHRDCACAACIAAKRRKTLGSDDETSLLEQVIESENAPIEPIYVGPTFALVDPAEQGVVCPMVVTEGAGYRAILYVRRAASASGERIAIGDPIADASEAIRAALAAAFIWMFSHVEDAEKRELLARQRALEHISDMGEWALNREDDWPLTCRHALQVRQEVAALNHAFFKDDLLALSMRLLGTSDRERLVAAGARAGALRQQIDQQLDALDARLNTTGTGGADL